jgi:lipopolysaccharide export system protein LptA
MSATRQVCTTRQAGLKDARSDLVRHLLRGLSAAAALAIFTAIPVQAQNARNQPNAMQGFSQNRNQPIKIESASLEVRDKERLALFVDNVRLTQGDTLLECKKLIVHYEGETGNSGAKPRQTPQALSGNSQQIRLIEAKGGVVVTQKDQTAVGDSGIYDMKNNHMTLMGNVVVTQGQNVVRGDRLLVDLATGVSRIETASSGTSPNRVQMVIQPGSMQQAPPAAATPAPPRRPPGGAARTPAGTPRQSNNAERDKPKQAPGQPQRLN